MREMSREEKDQFLMGILSNDFERELYMERVSLASADPVMLFGFRVSGRSQIYFVYDESQTIGEDGKLSQGPNAVISMIDWALKQHCPLASSFSIHADNCPGQNKNRHVASGFDAIKKRYRVTNVETLADMADVAEQSSVTNTAITYPL
ncbi:hypothetical protein DPMN_116814 [Dreissena polymorpha]|uniref:Uncharacterized protein n=1 Tax=Dreissena polymorpha TaxID=45954 RepID=A0A9D4QV34_DREPO|nr:hypothetical protein DPMN_116814 [Dreissena polymorpha]